MPSRTGSRARNGVGPDERGALRPGNRGAFPPGSRRIPKGGKVRRFRRETHAGETAITAATVTVMTVFGAALIVNHVWPVDQRGRLKTAANAASIAATIELQKQPDTKSDEDVNFINHPAPDEPRGAFSEIARQLVSLRRTIEPERSRRVW